MPAMRKHPISTGRRAWLVYPTASHAVPDWSDNLEVTIVDAAGIAVIVRDAVGRELKLPHFCVCTGCEFKGRAEVGSRDRCARSRLAGRRNQEARSRTVGPSD